jgi:hypothetical protein
MLQSQFEAGARTQSTSFSLHVYILPIEIVILLS